MTGKKELRVLAVTVLANIYFDGAVQSRTLTMEDGRRLTLGVYLPGEYTFDSHEPETVEITCGYAEVLMPGDAGWRRVGPGEKYDVPPDCTFQVRTAEITEYICEFL